MALPIKPSTFLTGVGINGTIEILDAFYSVFDFNGKATAQPVLTIKVKTEGGKEQTQHYPIGSLVAVAPSQDGNTPAVDDSGNYGVGPYLCAQKENITALFGDSDFAFFLTHLVNSGFPESKMPDDGDARFLIGLVAEFGPAPKKYVDQSGTEKSRTVAVSLKVVKLPGEKGKVAVASAGAGKATSASAKPAANGAATGATDHSELATGALIEALGTADGNILEISKLPAALIKPLTNTKTADRMAAIKLVKTPEFLNGLMEQGSVLYDESAGTVQLAA